MKSCRYSSEKAHRFILRAILLKINIWGMINKRLIFKIIPSLIILCIFYVFDQCIKCFNMWFNSYLIHYFYKRLLTLLINISIMKFSTENKFIWNLCYRFTLKSFFLIWEILMNTSEGKKPTHTFLTLVTADIHHRKAELVQW